MSIVEMVDLLDAGTTTLSGFGLTCSCGKTYHVSNPFFRGGVDCQGCGRTIYVGMQVVTVGIVGGQ